jgi:hypothetical protein
MKLTMKRMTKRPGLTAGQARFGLTARHTWFAPVGLLLAVGTAHADQSETAARASAPERTAIEHVLDNYTKAVTDGDETLFMTTLV